MKKKKVMLVGSQGRMGREIASLLSGHENLSLAQEFNRKDSWAKIKPGTIDVIIDFSLPEGVLSALAWALKNNTPYVCGVTGLGAKEKAKLKSVGNKVPVFYSANLSFGVAVLKKALESLTRLEGFDIVIEETHHNRKKDKPSGTALSLIDSIEKSQNKKPDEIHAIRGGGVIGTHIVRFMSQEEILTFEHQALDRAVFAQGAIKAAEWILKQKPGLYGMRDMVAKA